MTESWNDNKEMGDKLPWTRFHKVIEVISLVILLTMIIYPFAIWDTLPLKIPMHFNAAGEIDRYGSRSELFLMPILSIFLYGLMSLVSAFPSAWNMPVTVTRENRDRVYQCTKSLLILMKMEVIALFGYLEYSITQVKNIPGAFLGIVFVVIFGTIIYYVVKMRKLAHTRTN